MLVARQLLTATCINESVLYNIVYELDLNHFLRTNRQKMITVNQMPCIVSLERELGFALRFYSVSMT